jgi:replicative DNA helicase
MENSKKKNTISKLDKLFQESLEDLKSRCKTNQNDTFLTTGFKTLDSLIGGWNPGELIILGARPGMGKTNLLLSIMMEFTRVSNLSLGLISLETSKDFLMERFIALESKVSVLSLRKARLFDSDWEQLGEAFLNVSDRNIFIAENPYPDVESIQELIEDMAINNGVKIVLFDYLQLIEGIKVKQNREQEISSVIRSLKQQVRELNIVLILASQLNRSVELRSGNKRPMLADLRDSGAIEEEADKVLFIHRPEVYGLDIDEEGNSLKGYTEIMVAKNRTGPCGDVIINFNKNTGRFFENVTDEKAFGDISLDDLPDHEPPF